MEAGAALIKDTPYDEITVEDITDACGMSKGTFYVHFPSKDQFFYAVCHADYDKLKETLSDEGTPLFLERLRNYCREWILINENVSIYYLQNYFSHMLDTEFHESTTGDADPIAKHREDIVACLEEALKSGELTQDAPIGDLADSILLTLIGYDVYGVMTRRRVEPAKWSALLANSLIDRVASPYSSMS